MCFDIDQAVSKLVLAKVGMHRGALGTVIFPWVTLRLSTATSMLRLLPVSPIPGGHSACCASRNSRGKHTPAPAQFPGNQAGEDFVHNGDELGRSESQTSCSAIGDTVATQNREDMGKN
jgi:hypothetical protein